MKDSFSKSYGYIRKLMGHRSHFCSLLYDKLVHLQEIHGWGFEASNTYLAHCLDATPRQIEYAKEKLKEAGLIVVQLVRRGKYYISKYLELKFSPHKIVGVKSSEPSPRTEAPSGMPDPESKVSPHNSVGNIHMNKYHMDHMKTKVSSGRNGIDLDSTDKMVKALKGWGVYAGVIANSLLEHGREKVNILVEDLKANPSLRHKGKVFTHAIKNGLQAIKPLSPNPTPHRHSQQPVEPYMQSSNPIPESIEFTEHDKALAKAKVSSLRQALGRL